MVSFDDLPAEILSTIFEIAIQDEIDEHWYQREDFELPERGFSGQSLLAPIHTSSLVRKVNLSHRPISRLIATKVLASGAARKHCHSERLLKLCADISENTLSDFDLTGFNKVRNKCPQELLSLFNIAMPSTASLRRLTISHFPREYDEEGEVSVCTCQACHSMGSDLAMKNVWVAAVQLLCNATSLQDCELEVSYIDPLFSTAMSHHSADVKARPTKLILAMEDLDSLTPELITFFSQLCGQAEELVLSQPFSGDTAGEVMMNNLILSICRSASPKLRILNLNHFIHRATAALTFNFEWRNLVKLRIHIPQVESWDDDERFEPIPALPEELVKRHLECLQSLAVPAWMLSYFEAPHLKQAALTLVAPSDQDLVVSQLRQWHDLDTLVLHIEFDVRDDQLLPRSRVIQSILRCLTPPLESDEKARGRDYACPVLLTLGITNLTGAERLFEWIEKTDDDDDDDVDAPVWPIFHRYPLIGFDLYHLDRRRRDLALEERALPASSLDARNGVHKCSPIGNIKIYRWLVDPMAWRLIVDAAADNGELRRCCPDPVKFHKGSSEGGAMHRHIHQMLEALWDLNQACYAEPSNGQVELDIASDLT